jgi:hypothetical protein
LFAVSRAPQCVVTLLKSCRPHTRRIGFVYCSTHGFSHGFSGELVISREPAGGGS